MLAGIGKVECDHGRDADPSCSREGAVNSAGAGGPMQFIASTWASYGVDGDGDGVADRWDPADAIFAAARYLRGVGRAGQLSRALFAYNHAGWYVRGRRVAGPRAIAARRLRRRASRSCCRAHRCAGAAPTRDCKRETTTPVRFVAGERAELSPGDGHVALMPAGAPSVVQAMIVAGNELQQLPYGPGGHPDPRGALEEDCSSTVNYVLYQIGVQADRGNRGGQPARSGLRPLGRCRARDAG